MAMIDEIKEQTMKMKEMNGKQKWEYFWGYYKFHVLAIVCILFFLITLTRDMLRNKDMVFCVAVFNGDTETVTEETTGAWVEDLNELFGINTDKEEIAFDTSYMLTNERNTSFDMSNMQKIMVLAGSRELDVMVANTAVFEYYAQAGFFYDLKDFLTEEQYERLKPYFYYTDGATAVDEEDDVKPMNELEEEAALKLASTIDHHDPATMEQPIPVGIFVEGSKALTESGLYTLLDESKVLYQGYPEAGIVGVPLATQHTENVQQFIDYFYN